jgi:hypothetical protein
MKMRRYINLIVLLLCLNARLYAQSPVLERKVSLQYRQVEIGNILKDLNKRYKLKFSYSNNIIPEHRKVNINIKNVMLKDALNDLFYETGVAFQVVGEQIVLKKGIRTNTSTKEYRAVKEEITPVPVLFDPSISQEDLLVSNSKDFIIDTVPDELNLGVPMLIENENYNPTKKELRKKYRVEKRMLKAQFYVLKDSIRRKGNHTLDKLEMKYNYVTQKMRQEFNAIKSSDGNKPTKDSIEFVLKKDSLVTEKKDDYIYRPFQFTFISPVGTNGQDCGKTVNSLSFNLLGGYSAGLVGIEMGGIANVEKDFVKGVQLAGVANVVKNKTEGIQLAGFGNVCGDTVKALQAAGFFNTVDGSFHGLQGAGFCNINSGSMRGLQGAGFLNVIQDSLYGIQLAGFANINNGNVNGIQGAGFLNIAKKVKGMQIGIINIADTVQGVPIGLLSIVRKGGYRKLDIFAAEALYANIAYKIGVRSFYNIFQGGAQFKGDKFRWAIGYGIGSEIGLGKKAMVNIENVTSSIWEPDTDIFNHQLNILHRLSTNFGVKINDRAAVYIGPSLNVAVSQYQDPDKTTIGSDLAPYSFYNHTFDSSYKDVNVKMWIGINAGIRF